VEERKGGEVLFSQMNTQDTFCTYARKSEHSRGAKVILTLTKTVFS